MTDLFGDPLAFLQHLVLQIPALLLAVTIHEVSHGLVADRLGDPTARLQGRLTLNPLPHLDPLGALAFVLVGFGWAKPVPVNAYNLKRPMRDMAMVAAAGPLSNFVVAFLGLLTLRLAARYLETPFFAEPVLGVLRYIYVFNLGLGIFNLIPLPPLDGGHFLPYLFPRASWTFLRQLEQYGPFILILLIMTNATRFFMVPLLGLLNGFLTWLVRLIV
ncbi:MAG TPA: site-2 protease family protein [Methylomirabilota bacterium]|jgi:Zn-dependent protease|nr:site-2 protease family protein [Methylomirabilota bacterium]